MTRSGYSVPGQARSTATLHSYYQPFIPSDYLLHIDTIGPSSAASRNSYVDDRSATITPILVDFNDWVR